MVDREGAVVESNNSMLSVQALASQLQGQNLLESQASISTSSHDENAAAKIRHHSEPHPPALLSGPNKKVKIIMFQDGLDKDGVALTSILINPDTNDCVTTWDAGCLNPPNKRQCRSMSIPNDGELHTRWLQTQARSHLHRPLALRPNAANSRSKSYQNAHHRSSLTGRGLPPIWSSLAPSDTSTPPESPRSRPSSASSGYFDSPLASSSNLNKHRCESLQTLPTAELHNTNNNGGDCSASMRVNAAKSMPSVADPSTDASPSKQMLLRCQSQPCVIHERRCGIKRRRDEQRPSINFNKMTETAFGRKPNECTVAANNRLSSPLKIRPVARYGQIFPERVLQTIASSPQDINHISAVPSNARVSTPDTTSPSAVAPPVCHTNANDSDSGCSTTDDELCDITNKMAATVDAVVAPVDFCAHKTSPCCSSGNCTCSYSEDAELGAIFVMEPAQDSELDLDMIENN